MVLGECLSAAGLAVTRANSTASLYPVGRRYGFARRRRRRSRVVAAIGRMLGELRVLISLIAVHFHQSVKVVSAVIEHLHADPFVEPVNAVSVRITEAPGDAVSWNASRREESSVGGSS